MSMRKRSSKRRWLKRWELGRWIPSVALIEHPNLRRRVANEENIYSVKRDAIIRKARAPYLLQGFAK